MQSLAVNAKFSNSGMPKVRRLAINRIIRLLSAEIGKEIQRKVCQSKSRRWVRDWMSRREKYGASSHLLKKLAEEDPAGFKNALRINSEKFDELLRLVTPAIEKRDTRMRMAISSKTKLGVTLRYLASGDSFRSLALLFRIPYKTISTLLPDVLIAVYEALDAYIKVNNTLYLENVVTLPVVLVSR